MMYLQTVLFLSTLVYFTESGDVDTHPNWKYIPENCGKSKESQFRIYGGQEATLGQFPWMVRIKGEDNGVQGFICGGVLISPNHVLTAAHCGEDIKIISVRVGEYDTAEDVDCDDNGCAPMYQDIEVEYFRRHPAWNISIIHNDIAIMKLAKNAVLSEYVQPICLPGRNKFFKTYAPKGEVKLAGWGYANATEDQILPRVLQFVNLPVHSLSYCDEFYPHYRKFLVAEDQLCIGEPNGQDTCEGDSGGPVMQEIKVDNNYRFYCLGVVSFGSSQCGKAPAIYTNVRAYLNWILDNL